MNGLYFGRMDRSDFGICNALIQNGIDVYFSYEKENEDIARELETVKAKGKGCGTLIDLKNKETIVAMIEKWKEKKLELHSLITAFHAYLPGKLEDFDNDAINRLNQENVEPLYICMKNCISLLMESKGMYCNIMDSCAFHYVPGAAVYGMMQAAGIGFVKSLAKEYGRYGICAFNIVTNIETGKKQQEEQEQRERLPDNWKNISEQIAAIIVSNHVLTGQSVFLDQFATDYLFC
jgi:NAD(P)-dependent dehydrogenase (short-subunit alcohol dehydrogenase family)